MGNALRTITQNHEGIAYFKKALDINPNVPEAISNLGGAYNDLGDLE